MVVEKKKGFNVFIFVALLLHLPLFAYPVLRLSHWLELSSLLTIAILIPVFFSQIFARKVLVNKVGPIVFFMRNTADFLLGYFFILLVLLVLFEVLVLITAIPDGVAAQSVIYIASAFVVFGAVSAMRPKLVNIKLHSDKLLKPIRFVQITDVHIGSRSVRFLETLMTRIETLDVDFLCITGDFIDQPNIPAEKLKSLALYSKPIYYCTGNHERYEDLDDILARLASHGVHVLRNSAINANGIQIIGIDDQEDALQVNKQLENIAVNRDIYSILLYHRPVGLEACDEKGVDLMLSGHTHGGQIVPFNFLVNRVFKRPSGLYSHGASSLYVSQGTGTWGPMIRLGTRSEITLFEVTNESEA
ncbi:MAG: putative MPP superfamily phosphohydrolase [Pseudohongiellaceae bacterium]|jgi:predicted MPP superfamily phosphohydrolase